MQELLIAVARGLVEDKDAVQVTVDPAREDGTVVYHLTVAEQYSMFFSESSITSVSAPSSAAALSASLIK